MPRKRALTSSQPQLTKSSSRTSVTEDPPKTVRSSAYDDNFEQYLIDNGIYPVDYDYGDSSTYPEPANLVEITAAMGAPRASLSPSRVTNEQFRSFRLKNKTASEGTVMRTIIPMITGDKDIPNEGHLPFTNLLSMTEEATVKPVPDFFDRADPRDLYKILRDHGDLNNKIVPTKHAAVPIAPNFSLEAKAAKGGIDVARRQAMADGAYEARGMHSLQNHGLDEPVYDGNAYSYSATYQAGNLRIYSHHPTAPTIRGGRPSYHMTQLRGYDLTDSRDAYRAGVAAVRNLRELAKGQRDLHVREANTRVTRSSQLYEQVGGLEVPQHNDTCSQSTEYSTLEYLSTHDAEEGENLASMSFDAAYEAEASLTTSFTSPGDPFQPKDRSKRAKSQSPPSSSRRVKQPASKTDRTIRGSDNATTSRSIRGSKKA